MTPAKNADAFVVALRDHLADHADPERAAPMAAYLKNQFPFFGIGTEDRRRLLKAFLAQKSGRPDADLARQIARRCWQEPERELHYCGQEILEIRSKVLTPDDFPLVEHLITTHAWWDTVDFLATKIVSPILRRHRESLAPTCEVWLESGNLWLQRTALLCQLKWKTETDREVLAHAIERTRKSPEFFLRKAIGWSLREMARTDPAWVIDLLGRIELSPLSRREASKHL